MPKTTLPFVPGEYALVAERITHFYERFPRGRIITELVSRDERAVTFRASVYRAPDERAPAATGWASEREGDGEVNAVACLENAETSAVGRALANLGFTASRHRPSREEMQGAERRREGAARQAAAPTQHVSLPIDRSRAASTAAVAALQRPTTGRSTIVRAVAMPDRQAAADAVTDALRLLAAAGRAGLAPRRVESLRARLTSAVPGAIGAHALERLERALRRFVAARRAVAAPSSRSRPAVQSPTG